MAIVFSMLGFMVLTLIIGKINLSIKFRKQVRELFGQSENISKQQLHKSQIDLLPEPVQRYFSYILKNRQSFISYVRIKHEGQFKTGIDKKWINIKGEMLNF